MASIVFQNEVMAVQTVPANLVYSTSANGVNFTGPTAGSGSILFPSITAALTLVNVTLSATLLDTTTAYFTVDRAYNGSQFAIETKVNGNVVGSSLFTVNTAASAVSACQVTLPNGFDCISANKARKWNLNG